MQQNSQHAVGWLYTEESMRAYRPFAKVYNSCPTLTTTHKRNQSHQNVQCFLNGRQIHIKAIIVRLSSDAFYVLWLYILIAARVKLL
jgi:hypothetical protein